jgi:outer membrane protein OmpA-like peptidoglycan-associated protein
MIAAIVLLFVLAALSSGCISTTTTSARVPSGKPHREIELGPDVTNPIRATWSLEEGHILVGQISATKGCLAKEVQPMQDVATTTRTSDTAGNVGWLVAGTGMLAGGVAMLAAGAQARPENGGLAGAGVTLGIVSIWPLKEAMQGFAFDATKEERVSSAPPSERIGTTLVECLPLQALANTVLALRGDGIGEVTAVIGPRGQARFELPVRAEVDPAARAGLSVKRPASGASLLHVGQSLGEVSLAPYAEAQVNLRTASDREAQEAIRAADQQEFTAIVHGDAAAKRSFSLECAATGHDDCFDAIDNDCDGAYDVGCGYQSGALQWTLAWTTGDDLDLHVVGPDGVEVFFARRQGGPSGLVLDVDCLGQFGGNCLAGNVENVFTPRDRRPPEGTYRAWVEVYRAAVDEVDPGRVIVAMLGGRVAGKTYRIPMALQAQPHVRVFFAFAVGSDRDGDSVIDAEDACPEHAGVFSTVSGESGCEDRDNDGVADIADACPDEPGIRRDRGRNGCPRLFGRARLTARGIEFDGEIHFASGSATLLPDGNALLRDIASAMREAPTALQRVAIRGHTDAIGDRGRNYALSRDRVKSVFEYLTRVERISSSRLSGNWYGPDDPIAANDTEAGRAKNRRVELRVLEPVPTAVASW